MNGLRCALGKRQSEMPRLHLTEGKCYPRPENADGQICNLVYTQTRVRDVPPDVFLKNRIIAINETSFECADFHLLRTRLYRTTRQFGLNTIQVTGYEPGDGATLIAFNLAVSIAKDTRQTALLIELNFRQPSICSLLGWPEVPGIRSHLLDGVSLRELFVSPGVARLTLLTAGGRISGPTELLGSAGMEAMMRELKARYRDRYIIVDTPAISEGPDSMIISEYVDGIILVARANHTPRDSIRSAADLLPAEKVLGIVLNDRGYDETGGWWSLP